MAHTLSIAYGGHTTGAKIVNIGNGGSVGSTTSINIGTSAVSPIVTIVGTKFASVRTAGAFDAAAVAPNGSDRLNYNGWLYATQFEGKIDGGTSW